MKKFFSVIVAAMLILASFSACGTKTADNKNGKVKIVTTVFPAYDWVKNIVGENSENVEVTLLLDKGVDLHSYQPSAEDIMKISDCDAFVYVGGESDGWVEDALKKAENKNMKVINLMDTLGEAVKEEEHKEGMQSEDEHEDNHDENEEHELDEHVWLSLKNAVKLCGVIADELSKIDEKNAEKYKNNVKAYIEKLNALDKEYEDAVSKGAKKTLVFGDRFPFRYLVDDYKLDYYAAFAGCSAETEASFETITFLSKKVDELSLNSILTIEGGDGKIAETVVNNTKDKNQKILTIDSMQGAVSDDASYLSIMENNLNVLKEALK